MFMIRKTRYMVFVCAAFLVINLSANGQSPTGIRPLPSRQGNYYDIVGVVLSITGLPNDRYRLTATVVKQSGDGPYNGGSSVVITREGHGEPLPARFGERIGKGPKWGHQQLGRWIVPPMIHKGNDQVSFSVETNGRGDFYAHLENVPLGDNPANNRSDKSNLINHTYYIETETRWFYPDEPKILIKSRLHGSSGQIEIPGLVPNTTFGLPTTVYDSPSSSSQTRIPVALAFNDINAISPYEHDVDGFLIGAVWMSVSGNCPPCEGHLNFDISWEHDGPPEFLLGGDLLMRAMYKDHYWLPSPYWSAVNKNLSVFVDIPFQYEKGKQLFKMLARPVAKGFFLAYSFSTDGKQLIPRSEVNPRMWEEVENKVKSSIESAIAKKVEQIEWNLNKKLRELCLTDRFGNSGDIVRFTSDNATLGGVYYPYALVLYTRVPTIPNKDRCGRDFPFE